MAQPKNSVLLALAALLGGALILGLAFLLGDKTPEHESVSVGQSSSRPTPATLTAPPDSRDGDGQRMTQIGPPSLSVVPVSPIGLPVSQAQIVATGPAGVREATGRASWADVESGPWVVEVRAEGYLPSREELTLVDGIQAELVVTMHTSVDVYGSVIDGVGAPVPKVPISFHPADRTASERRGPSASVMTSADGTFVAHLDEARAYLVKVGPGSRPLLETPSAVQLDSGRHDVQIVVPGAGAVRLVLDDPPAAVLENEGAAQARLYALRPQRLGQDPASARTGARAEQRSNGGTRTTRPPSALPDPSQRPAGSGREQRSPKGARLITKGRKSDPGDVRGPTPSATGGSTNPPAETGTVRQQATGGAKPLGPEWAHKGSKDIANDGSANFAGLSQGEEYRLVIEFKRVRFQSTRSFQLQPGRSVTLRVSLPPLPIGPDGKRLKGVVEPLEVHTEYYTPEDGVSNAGFHWKE